MDGYEEQLDPQYDALTQVSMAALHVTLDIEYLEDGSGRVQTAGYNEHWLEQLEMDYKELGEAIAKYKRLVKE